MLGRRGQVGGGWRESLPSYRLERHGGQSKEGIIGFRYCEEHRHNGVGHVLVNASSVRIRRGIFGSVHDSIQLTANRRAQTEVGSYPTILPRLDHLITEDNHDLNDQ